MKEKEFRGLYAKIKEREAQQIPAFDQLLERAKGRKLKHRKWYALAATISILIYVGIGGWFGFTFFKGDESTEIVSISDWQSPTDFSPIGTQKLNTITNWKPESDFSKNKEELIIAVSNWQSPTDFLLSN